MEHKALQSEAMAEPEEVTQYLIRYLTVSESHTSEKVDDARIYVMFYLTHRHNLGLDMQYADPSKGELETQKEWIKAKSRGCPHFVMTTADSYSDVQSFVDCIHPICPRPWVFVMGQGEVDSHFDLPLPKYVRYFNLEEYGARETDDDPVTPIPEAWCAKIDEFVETLPYEELPPGGDRTIIRTIEFPPELYQSGLSILSYFGQIVRQKYPDVPVKVGIEQEGLKVRLIIQTPGGEQKEMVEKTLHEYGLIVTGNKPIEEFLDDPYQVIEMRSQLRFAEAQLENKRELLASERARRAAAEDQAEYFRQLLSETLQRSHDRQMALQETVQTLAKESSGNVRDALQVIEEALDQGLSEADLEVVKEAVETVREEDPTVFRRLYDAFIKEPLQGRVGVKILEILSMAPSMLPPP